MSWLRFYGFPLLVTLILHVGVFYLLDVSWNDSSSVYTPVVSPSIIKASVVALPKKQARKKTNKKKKPIKKNKKQSKKIVPKKKNIKSKKEPKKENKKEIEQEVKSEPAPINFDDELALEDEILAAESDTEIANSYIAMIMALVEQEWSRPPSARNGMEVELMVQLVPTGELVNVSVTKSSGNIAFDNSAVNAINKVGSFPQLQGMPNSVFEQYFRRFKFKFKPEDLRL